MSSDGSTPMRSATEAPYYRAVGNEMEVFRAAAPALMPDFAVIRLSRSGNPDAIAAWIKAESASFSVTNPSRTKRPAR